MIFELATGDYLFDPKADEKGFYGRDEDHLALIAELCGPFPLEVTQHGRVASQYFDAEGYFRNIPKLDYWPLYDVLHQKYKFRSQDAKDFAHFLACMLQVDPSKRASAKQMLIHPWLHITAKDKNGCVVCVC
ncbi:hypothetical protein RFI_29152, partial [Reticulomyxa filosa]